MVIELYTRKDRYEHPIGKAKFLDKNLILGKDDVLLPGLVDKFPNNGRKYIHFEHGYSPVYSHESDGKVNTRIRYISETNGGNKVNLYCKLNWIQRQRLKYIARQSLYHKYPIPTLTLLLTTLISIFGLYRDIFVYKPNEDGQKTPNQIHSEQIIPNEKENLEHQNEINRTVNFHDTLGNDTLR